MRSLVLLSVLAVVVAAPGHSEPAAASPKPPEPAANIHFSLQMIDTDAEGKAVRQVVETLTVADRKTRTHAGWKVPVPISQNRPARASEPPAVSYSYQDVGLSLSVRGSITESGRILAGGQVEISGVDNQPASRDPLGPMPQIGTFSHHFEATLIDGKATELVAVPKPGGGFVELLLTASIRP